MHEEQEVIMKKVKQHSRVKHTSKCFGVCFDPQLSLRIEKAAQMEQCSISDWFEVAAELLLSQSEPCQPETPDRGQVKLTEDKTK